MAANSRVDFNWFGTFKKPATDFGGSPSDYGKTFSWISDGSPYRQPKFGESLNT